MANETGSTTSLDDFFRSKLRTFALANGWTDSEGTSAAGRQYLHKTGSGLSCYVAFRWDTGTPANVGVYQALGYVNSGTVPGNHTNDSGSGIVTSFDNTNVTSGRYVPLDNDTNNYWLFEDDHYIHAVIETSSGVFRHFGFGQLAKIGTWTGGEYAYGHRANGATATDSSVLLDGFANGTSPGILPFCATLHIESAPSQAGGGKWGVVCGDRVNSLGNDRGGTGRAYIQGGFRSGPFSFPFSKWGSTVTQGLVPLTPIVVCYGAGTSIYPLGQMKDVRAINIGAYAPGQQITIGSDTWVVFPTVTKGGSTLNQGIAYRLVA